MNTPIQDRIKYLESLFSATDHMCYGCRCDESACDVCNAELDRLSDEIDNAYEELRDSDESRVWAISDNCGSGVYAYIEASSADEALDEAASDLYLHDGWAHYTDDGDSYYRTVYLTLRAHCEITDESEVRDVVMEPDEPECTHNDGHEWVESADWLDSDDRVCCYCGCVERTESGTDNHGIDRVYTSYHDGIYDEQLSRLKLERAVELIENSGILDDLNCTVEIDRYGDCRVNVPERMSDSRIDELDEQIKSVIGDTYNTAVWSRFNHIDIEIA
jgi:hypothetical protein